MDGSCLVTCLAPNPYAYEPTRRCQSLCPAPTWGIVSTNFCEDNCPAANFYQDTSDRVCKSCHSSCATCSGSASKDCLSCSGSLYLYGGQCLASCGTGKYGSTTDNTCKSCTSPCKDCTTPNEPTKGTSCSPNLFLKSNQCLSSCDSNQYKDYADQTCKSCHADCLTCYGPNINNCLTCGAPRFHDEDTDECLSLCSGVKYSYIDGSLRKCYRTCQGNYYGNNSTRSCDLACTSINQYKDDADNICKPCFTNCATCSGPLETNCLTCSGARYLTLENKCELSCGNGYYGKSSDNKCYVCTPPCQTCETPDQPTKCLSCGECYFLQATNCVDTCDAPNYGITTLNTCALDCLNLNEFKDDSDRVCKACDSTCKTCSNALSTGCLSCDAPRFLYVGECISECPKTKIYTDSSARECKACHSTCLTCCGPLATDCTQCSAPYYLFEDECLTECPLKDPLVYGNQVSRVCSLDCPSNTYKDKEAKLCRDCDLKCETCFRGGDNGCLTCKAEYLYTRWTTYYLCSEKCPDRYYQVPSTKTCKGRFICIGFLLYL